MRILKMAPGIDNFIYIKLHTNVQTVKSHKMLMLPCNFGNDAKILQDFILWSHNIWAIKNNFDLNDERIDHIYQGAQKS